MCFMQTRSGGIAKHVPAGGTSMACEKINAGGARKINIGIDSMVALIPSYVMGNLLDSNHQCLSLCLC